MGNREDTTQRILTAALEILAEQGFGALGINQIARRAEADKQLIYRYFGGIDGLLSALGHHVAARLTLALGSARSETYADMAKGLLLALLRFLRQDAQYRQLRLMEVAAPTPATASFSKARSEALRSWLMQTGAGLTPPQVHDLPALNAVLIAAVEGMSILGSAGLTGDAVLAREEAALLTLVDRAFGTPESD
ncbi:MAG: hypothetical protein RIR04_1907 [Pseudomonadota bacterium]